MLAVVTTGHGGYDKLEWRRVPVPEFGAEDVLLRVLSAGVIVSVMIIPFVSSLMRDVFEIVPGLLKESA